jgi:hypothetical protein
MRPLVLAIILCSVPHGAIAEVPKDRYSLARLQADDEVLVAPAKHPSRYKEDVVRTVYFYHDPEPAYEPEVTVTSCVEYNGECKPSRYFEATITEE